MSYDVLLDSDRDIPQFDSTVSGLEIVAQRVETRLRTFLGEWILDKTQGLPYLAWTQQRPVDVEGIGLILQAEIEGTPGVTRIVDWVGSLSTSQVLSYSGSVLVEEEEDPLTIEVLPLGTPATGNTSAAIALVTPSGRIVAGHAIVRS